LLSDCRKETRHSKRVKRKLDRRDDDDDVNDTDASQNTTAAAAAAQVRDRRA